MAEEEACVKNIKINWIDRNGLLTLAPTWFEVELWSASWFGLRQSHALQTKIQSRSPNKDKEEVGSNTGPDKDIEKRWSNRGPSYIQFNPLQTKIQSNMNGTHDSYIQYALSTSKNTETTTLWMEHTTRIQPTTISQQRYRYRGNNIVEGPHDLHIFHLTYIQSDLWSNIFI